MTGLNITNSTGAGINNPDNSTTSNTQTSSGQGEDDKDGNGDPAPQAIKRVTHVTPNFPRGAANRVSATYRSSRRAPRFHDHAG